MTNYKDATTLPVYVSYCLAPCEECTKFYADETGTFLLKCDCGCHCKSTMERKEHNTSDDLNDCQSKRSEGLLGRQPQTTLNYPATEGYQTHNVDFLTRGSQHKGDCL